MAGRGEKNYRAVIVRVGASNPIVGDTSQRYGYVALDAESGEVLCVNSQQTGWKEFEEKAWKFAGTFGTKVYYEQDPIKNIYQQDEWDDQPGKRLAPWVGKTVSQGSPNAHHANANGDVMSMGGTFVFQGSEFYVTDVETRVGTDGYDTEISITGRYSHTSKLPNGFISNSTTVDAFPDLIYELNAPANKRKK